MIHYLYMYAKFLSSYARVPLCVRKRDVHCLEMPASHEMPSLLACRLGWSRAHALWNWRGAGSIKEIYVHSLNPFTPAICQVYKNKRIRCALAWASGFSASLSGPPIVWSTNSLQLHCFGCQCSFDQWFSPISSCIWQEGLDYVAFLDCVFQRSCNR